MKNGFFGIGIFQPDHEVNVAGLFRSAYCFGADFIFTIGRKYHKLAADTPDSSKHIPCYRYLTFDDFIDNIPKNARLVGIENKRARPISNYVHPLQAIYILGNEGGGLPDYVLDKCNAGVLEIPTNMCLNVQMKLSKHIRLRLYQIKTLSLKSARSISKMVSWAT